MVKYRLMENKKTGERCIVQANKPIVWESKEPELYAKLRKLAVKNRERRAKDECMRDMGLTKVYGAVSGKVYWE